MGTNIDLNTESFPFLDSSGFMTTEWYKARITTLVMSDRTLPSITRECDPKILEFLYSTCFIDTPPTCVEHWTGFLQRCRTSALEVLIFIPAMSNAAIKQLNAYRKPDSEEASTTKSSAKSNRLILHLPIMTHSSVRLSLFIQFM